MGRKSFLSPFNEIIEVLLNDFNMGGAEICQYLNENYGQSLTTKQVIDRISYLKKNRLIGIPQVTMGRGNAGALPGVPTAVIPRCTISHHFFDPLNDCLGPSTGDDLALIGAEEASNESKVEFLKDFGILFTNEAPDGWVILFRHSAGTDLDMSAQDVDGISLSWAHPLPSAQTLDQTIPYVRAGTWALAEKNHTLYLKAPKPLKTIVLPTAKKIEEDGNISYTLIFIPWAPENPEAIMTL